MKELKIVIPAIIDFCRYGNNELRPNNNYFLNSSVRQNWRFTQENSSVFTLDEIKIILNKINISHPLEKIVSGEFIIPTDFFLDFLITVCVKKKLLLMF